MRIEVYLDDADTPFRTLTPPERFRLDTEEISDGDHKLTFKAIDDDGAVSSRSVAFKVQNGPAIAVHGVVDGDVLTGAVPILANAYGSKIGDEFEPVRMETPTPVPTWAWVLVLCVLAWGAGYLSLELHDRIDTVIVHKESGDDAAAPSAADALGAQVYGINCASCHQGNGTGLAGVFPPLTANAVVLADDPTEHIAAILDGVADKVIDGVAYASPMPGFAALLSDEEVAAVVNHERTQWGNSAQTVTAEEVAAVRGSGVAADDGADVGAEDADASEATEAAPAETTPPTQNMSVGWEALGQKTYDIHCIACHQASGAGIPGVFPPLTDNAVVLAEDPTDHILSILQGVSDKVIDGVAYPAPMQAFATLLSDAEIAAVVNHERTQWGNGAGLVTAEDVARLR